jgi:hypothetical protein
LTARKLLSGKSLFGTPALTGFNIVIHKNTLVGPFNRGSGLKLFLDSIINSMVKPINILFESVRGF